MVWRMKITMKHRVVFTKLSVFILSRVRVTVDRVHESPLLALILIQMNPVHAVTSYFYVHFNIIISVYIFLAVSFLQVFLPKSCMHFSQMNLLYTFKM
jgi:hypothetical protein